MAKTNFTKVEDALNEGLLKMNIAGLHEAATTASQKEPTGSGDPAAQKRLLVAAIQFELKHCKDDQLFAAGGFSRGELKKALQRVEDITPEKWKQLEDFRQKASDYKKSKAEKQPEDANEKLIDQQKKKHVNKRYNTKDQWLPLH